LAQVSDKCEHIVRRFASGCFDFARLFGLARLANAAHFVSELRLLSRNVSLRACNECARRREGEWGGTLMCSCVKEGRTCIAAYFCSAALAIASELALLSCTLKQCLFSKSAIWAIAFCAVGEKEKER